MSTVSSGNGYYYEDAYQGIELILIFFLRYFNDAQNKIEGWQRLYYGNYQIKNLITFNTIFYKYVIRSRQKYIKKHYNINSITK